MARFLQGKLGGGTEQGDFTSTEANAVMGYLPLRCSHGGSSTGTAEDVLRAPPDAETLGVLTLFLRPSISDTQNHVEVHLWDAGST